MNGSQNPRRHDLIRHNERTAGEYRDPDPYLVYVAFGHIGRWLLSISSIEKKNADRMPDRRFNVNSIQALTGY